LRVVTNAKLRALNVAFAVLCLGSCAVGPNYVQPALPVGAQQTAVSFDASVESKEGTPDAWWRLYNDPVLDGLLNEAFAANFDLKAAEANLAAARAILEGAKVARYPTTELSAASIRGRDPNTNQILGLTGREPRTQWVYDASFDMSYELDLFGRVRRTIEAARAEASAAAAARDDLKVTLAAETTRAYVAVCALGEQIAVAQRNLALVSDQARMTEGRRQAGASSEFDVTRAQALVAGVRARIPPLEGRRRAARFQLAALIGRVPSAAPTDVLNCTVPPRLASLIPVGDGAMLLRRRPDIRESERVLAAATAGIGIATADLYPRVRLLGLFGSVSDDFHNLGTSAGGFWQAGPSISWQFPNMAGTLARIRQRRAGAAGALAHFESVVLQALGETEQTLATYSAELEHHADLLELEARSRHAYELANQQFRSGAISNLDLLTAEEALVAAEEQVAVSDAAVVQDQVAVFKALGGGWATEVGR